ncbi:MAG TPA: tripartite tricarboxylate transporter substrate binding protein [Burkholderiales bacterium]|nr:tripartite tricarboxylate transporter substrate binding protein [Burkholderiales bacterium]
MAILLAYGFIVLPAGADEYPTQNIRLISPFTPGGGNDIVARTTAAEMSKNMSHALIVDNRPGANSIVGMDLAAKAPPNGYTLIMASSAMAVNATLYSRLPFDTVKDFAPVSLAGSTPFVVAVHPSLPVRNVRELIAFAKRKPGELLYPSSGTGNSTHLAGELFSAMAGVKLVHVPYKGTAPGLTDLIAGRLSLVFNAPVSVLPHIAAGRLRAIAVTSSSRSSVLPELPTVAESGLPGYEANTWHGVLAPAQTPMSIIGRLNSEIIKALRSAQVKERFAAVGVEPQGNTPTEFAKYIQAEIDRWAKVIKSAGVKPE